MLGHQGFRHREAGRTVGLGRCNNKAKRVVCLAACDCEDGARAADLPSAEEGAQSRDEAAVTVIEGSKSSMTVGLLARATAKSSHGIQTDSPPLDGRAIMESPAYYLD